MAVGPGVAVSLGNGVGTLVRVALTGVVGETDAVGVMVAVGKVVMGDVWPTGSSHSR